VSRVIHGDDAWREANRRRAEKHRLQFERQREAEKRIVAWGPEVYSLPPDQRPYGQRGKYPKPPIYPKLPDGSTFCRWCGTRTRGRRWCADGCVSEFMRRGHWPTMARFITKRDKVCRLCGGYRWTITEPRRYAGREGWPDGLACYLTFSHAVDHIVAVKDGGTDDPANLRLLCGRCHSEVTAAQHARWSAERRAAAVADSGQKRLEL
jgi:5-methylcytosine-specific restriction endonuclease McrA